jgi:hypothetical protein
MSPAVIPHTRTLPLMAFRNIVANKIPEHFLELRFGFIEAGASWVPYALHALRSVFGGSAEQGGPRLFQEYRLYTAYEEWEDLPYLVRYVGEDDLAAAQARTLQQRPEIKSAQLQVTEANHKACIKQSESIPDLSFVVR